MKKKLFSLALVGLMTLSLCACGNNTTKDSSALKNELVQAVEGLDNMSDTYIISTSLQTPAEASTYIEVVGTDYSYTEYPVDSEGNVISSLSDSVGNSYMLSDWMTSDKFYIYSADASGNAGFYTLPDSYMETCKEREVMYANTLLEGVSNITDAGTIKSDLGDGEKEYKLYEATISSDKVKEMMSVGSYDLYDSLKTTYTDNANLVKYAGFMTEELDFNLVFGDAKATFAVSDGILRYITLEIGGLGTRMYVTKTVLVTEVAVRETPDFTGAKEYSEALQGIADYVAKYDTYDEALNDLNSGAGLDVPSVSTDATTTEETVIETSESSEDTSEATEENTELEETTTELEEVTEEVTENSSEE